MGMTKEHSELRESVRGTGRDLKQSPLIIRTTPMARETVLVPKAVELVMEPPAPDAPNAAEYPRLEWKLAWDRSSSPPLAGCLDRFIRLADATPQQVLAYARDWGPLGICGHRQPRGHARPVCPPRGRLTASPRSGQGTAASGSAPTISRRAACLITGST